MVVLWGGGYGPLGAIARNKVNLGRIETWWPDMLRAAGSLITNQVRAYDLLRTFGREGRMSPLDAAVTELEAAGHDIPDADKARLSPLKEKHLNCLGRYAFTASQPATGLRPLRDPTTREDPDDL